MKIIKYDPSLKIVNIEQLPRGRGARYLDVLEDPAHGVLIAIRWRQSTTTGTLIDFKKTSGNPIPEPWQIPVRGLSTWEERNVIFEAIDRGEYVPDEVLESLGGYLSDARFSRAKAGQLAYWKQQAVEGKPVPPEVLADYPELKATVVAQRATTGTRWQQAQAQAIARIEEIESEWVAKRFYGPTKEQQDRIYAAIADTANEYGVPESTLRRAVLWEARTAGAKLASLTVVECDRQYSLSELKSKARAEGISTSGDKKALCRKLMDAGVL